MALTKTQIFRLRIFISILVLANAGAWYYHIRQESSLPATKDARIACDVKGFRRAGYKFTKPLLMLDRGCDDPSLDPIRGKVLSLMADCVNKGEAKSISVYFRMLNTGKNFNTSDETFSPGSLMKIMTLITYLKDAEADPTLLDKKLLYNLRFSNVPSQLIEAGRSAEFGKSYSVRELLDMMIIYSDNNSTILLNQNLDYKVYNEVLVALNMPVPDPDQQDYPITAEQMSRFFRLLYNSSFLSPEMSDMALELLTRSAYKNGFIRYLPADLPVARKFGERNVQSDYQLHEGGIFFTGVADYVLVVMSRGTDQSKLQNAAADISKLVYEEIAREYGVTPSAAPALTQAPVGPTGRS